MGLLTQFLRRLGLTWHACSCGHRLHRVRAKANRQESRDEMDYIFGGGMFG